MNREKLVDATVPISGTVRDALLSLERSGCEIALVVSGDGRLCGVSTDGDVRRAILRGVPASAPVSECMRSRFSSVSPEATRNHVLDLMQARLISGVPVVDAEGRLHGLHLLHEVLGATPRSNTAVIMAGGRGARLGELTARVPKPMLQVAGRPIIERIVLHLMSYGIRRFLVAVNYLAHVIETHLGDGAALGCHIEYLREDRPLGSGGALSLLRETPEEPVLVMNGDLVTQADIGGLLEAHGGGHTATVAVRRYHHTIPFGCVDLEGSRIIGLVEKPTLLQVINAGIYVFAPQVLSRVPSATEYPITRLVEDCLERGESVGAFEVQGDWIDVGHQSELRRAREGGHS